MDMLQWVEHILHNQVNLMVKVNNLRHLVKWNDKTKLFAVAYGRFVIKMLLWEEVEAGKTANTTMLTNLGQICKHFRAVVAAAREGGSSSAAASVRMRRRRGWRSGTE